MSRLGPIEIEGQPLDQASPTKHSVTHSQGDSVASLPLSPSHTFLLLWILASGCKDGEQTRGTDTAKVGPEDNPPVATQDSQSALAPSLFLPMVREQEVTTLNGDKLSFRPSNLQYMAAETAFGADDPKCDKIPTSEDIKTGNFDFENSLMTVDQAADAKLPVASIGDKLHTMVLVVDYRKSAECDTQDPDIKLVYGHSIRAVVTLQNFDASLGTSFPFLAASATIGRKSQKVSIQTQGFDNPELGKLIATINNKDLNVENYAAFDKFLSGIPQLPADPKTTLAVRLLGRRDASKFGDALALSFALYQLSKGQACDQVKSKLPKGLETKQSIVEAAFAAIMGSCKPGVKPDAEYTTRAQKRLMGLKVST